MMFTLTDALTITLIVVVLIKGAALSKLLLGVNAKLEMLLRHFSVTITGQTLQDEIDAALDVGDNVRAIKVYREVMGVGLAEAKRAIAEMDARRTTKLDRS